MTAIERLRAVLLANPVQLSGLTSRFTGFGGSFIIDATKIQIERGTTLADRITQLK